MSAIEAGAEFGPSSWIEVPQEKIQAFADTTGDHNFIHVDPEMAAQTPFGGTVAHGYLTLSLLPAMSRRTAKKSSRIIITCHSICVELRAWTRNSQRR